MTQEEYSTLKKGMWIKQVKQASFVLSPTGYTDYPLNEALYIDKVVKDKNDYIAGGIVCHPVYDSPSSYLLPRRVVLEACELMAPEKEDIFVKKWVSWKEGLVKHNCVGLVLNTKENIHFVAHIYSNGTFEDVTNGDIMNLTKYNKIIILFSIYPEDYALNKI